MSQPPWDPNSTGPGGSRSEPPSVSGDQGPLETRTVPPTIPPTPDPFAEGTIGPRRLGDYDLLSELGRGAMGIVFLGQHRVLGRKVAIKLLPGARFAATDWARRLLIEARIGASLQHPHLCQVLDAGQFEGEFYIVMEYLEGQTLANLLRSGPPLPLSATCSFGRQLLEVAGYLASRGIVHRDIKPGNIMVCPGEHLKLMDLGLAKNLGPAEEESDQTAATAAGQMLGTPAYMAPEQIENARAVTPQADLYAIGATLFQMTTGEVPFRASTHIDLLNLVRLESAPDPRSLRPDLPPELADLILQLLRKEPGRRPTYDVCLQVLDTLMGESLSLRRSSVPSESVSDGPGWLSRFFAWLFTRMRRRRPAPIVEQPLRKGRAVPATDEPGSGATPAPDFPEPARSAVAARIAEAAQQYQGDADDLLAWLPTEGGEVRVGDYVLEERIGPKAVINTYRAHHQLLKIPYIVRLLPPAFSQMAPDQLQALMEERARLMEISKRSRHFAQLLNVGSARLVRGNFKTLYYTVEDYLPGDSLEQAVGAKEALPVPEARRCLTQLLRGMHSLHRRRLLHGNLHPGKVFVEPGTRRVRLADLSHARGFPGGSTVGRKEQTICDVGWLGGQSPRRRQYIAPEMLCNDEPLGPLAEQYVLGVMLIEALSGRFLRTDANDLKLLQCVRADLEDSLEEICRREPALGALLRRMVYTNPGSRYPGLAEVLETLGQARVRRPGKPRAVAAAPPTPEPDPNLTQIGPYGLYDVFINYRAATGADAARLISQELEKRGLRVFFDKEKLRKGPFPVQLMRTIEVAPHFVAVLSEGCLERCQHERDWVRQEIACALKNQKNIIPVHMPEFVLPELDSLPQEIRQLLEIQGVQYNRDYFGAFIDKLVGFLVTPESGQA